MNNPSPFLLLPAFIAFFILMILVVSTLLSRLSGWHSLVKLYQSPMPDGDKFSFASATIGHRYLPVNYSNCLKITVNEDGFGMVPVFPFRFQNPPIFMRWENVSSVTKSKILLFNVTRVEVKNAWPYISLFGRSGLAVRDSYAAFLNA